MATTIKTPKKRGKQTKAIGYKPKTLMGKEDINKLITFIKLGSEAHILKQQYYQDGSQSVDVKIFIDETIDSN